MAVWPEPDLPRTSTGKVKRKTVAAWVAGTQAAIDGRTANAYSGNSADGDWLLALIAATTGETPSVESGDDVRSVRTCIWTAWGVCSLQQLWKNGWGHCRRPMRWTRCGHLASCRRLVGGEKDGAPDRGSGSERGDRETADSKQKRRDQGQGSGARAGHRRNDKSGILRVNAVEETITAKYIYPRWPWWAPVRWIRAAVPGGSGTTTGVVPCESARLWVAAHSTLRNQC